MKNKKGFTLIEIMIVVVIIGILASLALPRLGNQVKKASSAEALSLLGSMARAAAQCYTMEDEQIDSCKTIELIGTNTGAQFVEETRSFHYRYSNAGNILTLYADYKKGTGIDGTIALTINLDSGAMAKCSTDPSFSQLKGIDDTANGPCTL